MRKAYENQNHKSDLIHEKIRLDPVQRRKQIQQGLKKSIENAILDGTITFRPPKNPKKEEKKRSITKRHVPNQITTEATLKIETKRSRNGQDFSEAKQSTITLEEETTISHQTKNILSETITATGYSGESDKSLL